MYVADYELYPELTNTGVEMRDVPEEAFTHEVVTAQNIADLIHDAIRDGARWWVKFRG